MTHALFTYRAKVVSLHGIATLLSKDVQSHSSLYSNSANQLTLHVRGHCTHASRSEWLNYGRYTTRRSSLASRTPS